MTEVVNKMETKLVPGVGRLPYPAYRGKEPYIFVSYAHVDSPRVFPEIAHFNEAGFHVWYDEGIAPGNEWSEAIAEALSNCAVFVVMITQKSAVRPNVLNEIDYALNENKPFLAIFLEETQLSPGLKLRISRMQAILKYNMSDEEYEFKFVEAFTRFGLPYEAKEAPAVQSAGSTGPGEAKAQLSSALNGAHPFGDYIPKGTAVLTEGLGKEYSAIGNSLVYKPVGKIEFQTLHNLVSMDKSSNGYVLKDTDGRESLLKTHPGDELLFLGAAENKGIGLLEPEKIQINMVETIRVDPENTPDRKICYCRVQMKDGVFLTPREFLFFSVNENNGTPPVMKLKKDLNKYSKKGYASLLMMKKLTVVKVGEAVGPYGDHRSLEVTVQYPGEDSETFTIDGYFAVYAMGADGEIHSLKREELQEIEVL